MLAFPRTTVHFWVSAIIEFPLSNHIGNPVINQFIIAQNHVIME